MQNDSINYASSVEWVMNSYVNYCCRNKYVLQSRKEIVDGKYQSAVAVANDTIDKPRTTYQ